MFDNKSSSFGLVITIECIQYRIQRKNNVYNNKIQQNV
jgi:hypothetical protein